MNNDLHKELMLFTRSEPYYIAFRYQGTQLPHMVSLNGIGHEVGGELIGVLKKIYHAANQYKQDTSPRTPFVYHVMNCLELAGTHNRFDRIPSDLNQSPQDLTNQLNHQFKIIVDFDQNIFEIHRQKMLLVSYPLTADTFDQVENISNEIDRLDLAMRIGFLPSFLLDKSQTNTKVQEIANNMLNRFLAPLRYTKFTAESFLVSKLGYSQIFDVVLLDSNAIPFFKVTFNLSHQKGSWIVETDIQKVNLCAVDCIDNTVEKQALESVFKENQLNCKVFFTVIQKLLASSFYIHEPVKGTTPYKAFIKSIKKENK